MLYFWSDRAPWWLRALGWALFVGAFFLFGWLFPDWTGNDVILLFCFIPMLVLNLTFGVEGEKFVDWAWKISAFILTVAVAFVAPNSPFGYGMKTACSLVVMLTLIYAIFGHTLMQNYETPCLLYDILFAACILVSWVLALFIPELTVGYPLENSAVVTIPYELALYLIAWLRFEPLFNLIERIVKGPSYQPARSSSSSKKSSVDEKYCLRCKYYRKTTSKGGVFTDHYCAYHHKELTGMLAEYNTCSDFKKR